MLEMVHVGTATGVTRGFERLLYCDVESKWKNYHIITFPGYSVFFLWQKHFEMLDAPQEAK